MLLDRILAPRWTQDGPKMAPRGPKMAPKRPKMARLGWLKYWPKWPNSSKNIKKPKVNMSKEKNWRLIWVCAALVSNFFPAAFEVEVPLEI